MKHGESTLEEFLTESYARFRELPLVPIDEAWDRVLSRLDNDSGAASDDLQVCLDAVRPPAPASPRWPVLVALAAVAVCAIGVSLLPSRFSSASIKRGKGGLYQSAQQFDVASIRLSISRDAGTTGINELPGGRVSVVNGRLREIIKEAHGLSTSSQLIGGPNWINSTRYDIQATAGVPVPPAQLMFMVQRLLEDRFRLKAHRETRELPVYVLTVAKGGSKLQQSTEGNCVPRETNTQTPPPRAEPAALWSGSVVGWEMGLLASRCPADHGRADDSAGSEDHR